MRSDERAKERERKRSGEGGGGGEKMIVGEAEEDCGGAAVGKIIGTLSKSLEVSLGNNYTERQGPGRQRRGEGWERGGAIFIFIRM